MINKITKDGTVYFYKNILKYVSTDLKVLDIGAGRGAWLEDHDKNRLKFRDLRGKVSKIVGLDISQSIKDNKYLDEAIIYDGNKFPFGEGTFDIIICDFVLEHISAVETFSSEIFRVLKENGKFFARTPHKFNYASLLSSLFGKIKIDQSILKFAQPNKKIIDSFKTNYKINTINEILDIFPTNKFKVDHEIIVGKPAYFFDNIYLYKFFYIIHLFFPKIFVGTILISLTKK